ncbi:MAG: hypothetical protein GF364_11240 [Candidatus Lokiarchaeota archaeon]|nr:hypothetical protein [Candidatus Lokiarchaeota archaeon]
MSIIKETFCIELIMLDNQNRTDWYPFLAYYPNWEIMIDLVYENTPKDGYWGALDVERIKSESYYNTKHLSSLILMIQSMELLKTGLNLTEQYFDFDLSDIKFSFMESNALNNLFSGVFSMVGMGGMGGSSGMSISGFGSFDINSFINGGSKVLATLLQYEGHSEGIQKSGNQYHFDLYKTLNYDVDSEGGLLPSEKVFVGLIGALLSGIDISIYSADIISWTPNDIQFSSFILETIELAAFIIGEEIDISMIENYSIALDWDKSDGNNKLISTIYDYVNPDNPINFLMNLLRMGRIPNLPTGILDPLDSLTVTYRVGPSEPTASIKKDYIWESVDTGEYSLNVTLTNNGNTTVWGKDILGDYVDITELIEIPLAAELLIETIHPDMTAEEYLGLDENPKFLLIDTFDSGFYDTLIPNFLNFSSLSFMDDVENLVNLDMNELMLMFSDFNILNLINFDTLNLYSPHFVDDIITYGLFGATEDDREFYENLYANENSIMNPDNWKINPGASHSYVLDDLSLFPLYDYDEIKTLNFTYNPPLEPFLPIGNTVDGTDANAAKIYDLNYWNITSENLGENEYISIYFTFKNDSIIDFENNTLDRLDYLIDYRSNLTLNQSNVFLEFYNHSAGDTGEFNAIDSVSLTNESIRFLGLKHLEDYFDKEQNYTSLFKITLITPEKHHLALDSVNLTISDRTRTLVSGNPAYLSYTTQDGGSNYILGSNDYISTTDNGPIIQAFGSVNRPNSYPGESNTYYLKIKNVGDRNATSVNVSAPIPGKITDIGNFAQIDNSSLFYSISNLQPNQEIDLWCDFRTPNSLYLPNAEITYNHEKIVNENHSDCVIYSNEVSLSAPVDYEWNGKKPYLDEIQLSFETNYSDANLFGGISPKVGDHIELNISVSCLNAIPINDITIVLPEFIQGFECLDSRTIDINNLQKGFPQEISVILNKTKEGAFYYDTINQICGSQKSLIRYESIVPLLLGYKRLNLTKAWSDLDGVHGSFVKVTINLTNIGNIIMHNLTVNDVLGFPKDGFILWDGVLDEVIPTLEPQESFSYEYTLKFRKQGTYNIPAAYIKYYYLEKQQDNSNNLVVKVRNYWLVNALWILAPSTLLIASTSLIYWWKHRYDLEAAQFERREELMFGSDYRSTAWDKFIIEEHLDALLDGREITSIREREEVY